MIDGWASQSSLGYMMSFRACVEISRAQALDVLQWDETCLSVCHSVILGAGCLGGNKMAEFFNVHQGYIYDITACARLCRP